MRGLPIVRSVLLAPLRLELDLRRVNSAQVAITAPQTLPHGPVSIVAEATTALTALELQGLAPTKCLQLADGALCLFKALPSSWKQPAALTTASGTSRRATAC